MGAMSDGEAAIDANAVALRAIVRRRMRVSLSLLAILLVAYFGLLSLVAFAKHWLAIELVGGLSLGLALAASVILGAWLLTWIYSRWAERRLDPACDRLAE